MCVRLRVLYLTRLLQSKNWLLQSNTVNAGRFLPLRGFERAAIHLLFSNLVSLFFLVLVKHGFSPILLDPLILNVSVKTCTLNRNEANHGMRAVPLSISKFDIFWAGRVQS